MGYFGPNQRTVAIEQIEAYRRQVFACLTAMECNLDFQSSFIRHGSFLAIDKRRTQLGSTLPRQCVVGNSSVVPSGKTRVFAAMSSARLQSYHSRLYR
jgi:hypothetical protein